ncbi:MAG: hypothetical protein WD226_05905 [Planctomycetota bacterium]
MVAGAAGAALGPRTAVTSFWIADRAGGEVLGLDTGFAVVERLPRRNPVRVAPVPGRDALWLASASQGFALGRHAVELIVDGQSRWSHVAGPVIDLDANLRSCVWVEWPVGEPARVFVAGEEGSLRRLDVEGRATSAALAAPDDSSDVAAGELALVGREDGWVELWRTRHPPTRVAAALVAEQVGDVVPAPDAGWYVLDVAARRLVRLEPDLAKRWAVDPTLSAASLTTSLDRSRVWIVDANQPFVRRFGPGGSLEIVVNDLPLSGFDRAAPTAAGGLVLVSPGAVLELGPFGTLLQSQGGFGFLTDVAEVR